MNQVTVGNYLAQRMAEVGGPFLGSSLYYDRLDMAWLPRYWRRARR